MDLGPGDEARLQRIEAELSEADPTLAARFRRWEPPSRSTPAAAGWSVVPAWVFMVFLVAFCGWVVSPGVGGLVAVGGALWGVRTVCHRVGLRHEQDAAWWSRPIDRR